MAQAGGRLRQNIKGKLSTTLKSWLPILQGDLFEVEDMLKQYANENPFINIKTPLQSDFTSTNITKKTPLNPNTPAKKALSDKIEQLTISTESLYEMLHTQIAPPLFPTPLSQDIANDIIQSIDADGYFRDDINECARNLGVEVEEYEKIRQRFAFLEPKGVGAVDVRESFCFQLYGADVSEDIYSLCLEIINNLDQHIRFRKNPHYVEAMRVIKGFKNPPALEFEYEESYKIADILIFEEDGNLSVRTNDEYYPIIEIDVSSSLFNVAKKNSSTTQQKDQEQYIKTKTKEARDLIDALEMRRATIKKVGLMIVDYQYDFFMGGEMRPMKLKDIAEELGYAPSTISRAISNKYLECQRGIFPIKSFFTTGLEGDVSNAAIKDFLIDIVKNENKTKPLSDVKILQMIEKKFGLKIVRRTITKYRKQLNIASSSERKKLYEIG